MLAALDIGANASSVHSAGRAARAIIEGARENVAALVGGDAERLVFTSGGAEANTLAVMSAVAAGGKRLIIGATEHASVVEAAKATGLPIDYFPVDAEGVSDLAWLAARLKAWSADDGAPFLALMMANNETGVIQPIAEAAALVHAAGGRLHVDAVAAAGKIALDMAALGADTLAISAHKLGAAQGAGALLYGEGVVLARQIHGGGHERGLRAGTENLSGIAGFGAAAKLAAAALTQSSEGRDAAAARLTAAGAVVLGQGAPRTAGVLCLAAEGFPAHLQVMALDLEGVMISAGSACSSGKVKPSGVLQAMGRDDLAPFSIRASGGWATTADDWARFADVWLAARARHAMRHAVKEVA
jgi:cysteine desulfurase